MSMWSRVDTWDIFTDTPLKILNELGRDATPYIVIFCIGSKDMPCGYVFGPVVH